jgi:hypothetical protein
VIFVIRDYRIRISRRGSRRAASPWCVGPLKPEAT